MCNSVSKKVPEVYMMEEKLLAILFEWHLGFTSFEPPEHVNSEVGLEYFWYHSQHFAYSLKHGFDQTSVYSSCCPPTIPLKFLRKSALQIFLIAVAHRCSKNKCPLPFVFLFVAG